MWVSLVVICIFNAKYMFYIFVGICGIIAGLNLWNFNLVSWFINNNSTRWRILSLKQMHFEDHGSSSCNTVMTKKQGHYLVFLNYLFIGGTSQEKKIHDQIQGHELQLWHIMGNSNGYWRVVSTDSQSGRRHLPRGEFLRIPKPMLSSETPGPPRLHWISSRGTPKRNLLLSHFISG
jgi:hypothetical protein